jgi:hypothetical protein
MLKEAGKIAEDRSSRKINMDDAKHAIQKVSEVNIRNSDDLEDDKQRGGYGGVIHSNGSMSDSTGAYSGFVAPGGAMYDKNGRYAGQVSAGGAMSDSTGRYNGSVNRGTIINNP